MKRRTKEECFSFINAFDLKHFFSRSLVVARFRIYVFILNTVLRKRKKQVKQKICAWRNSYLKIYSFFFLDGGNFDRTPWNEHTHTNCTIHLSKPSFSVAYLFARGATSSHIICFIDYKGKSNIEKQHTRRERLSLCFSLILFRPPTLVIVQTEWKIHAFFTFKQ